MVLRIPLTHAAATAHRRRVAPLRELEASILGHRGEAATAAVLERLGLPALHDVVLEDGQGLTQIDHLVLLDDAIVVLETKNFSGLITGRPDGRHWTQQGETGGLLYRLRNPLRQNDRHLLAVAHVVADPAVALRGHVVAAGPARFLGAIGDLVVPLVELDAALTAAIGPPVAPLSLETAWLRLCAAAAGTAARREAHTEQVTTGRKKWR